MEALIRNFGLVRTSPMLYQEDGNLTSSCLPSKMEEYGEDHQLLYKTLNEMREDAKVTIEIQLKIY